MSTCITIYLKPPCKNIFFYLLHLLRRTQISLNMQTFLVAVIYYEAHSITAMLKFFQTCTNAVRITGINENVQNGLFQQNCLRMLKSVETCLRFALALLLES